MHTSPDTPGTPPLLLGKHALPVAYARDGQRPEHGRVYIAPPDQHLVLQNGCVRVGHGPRENGFRPAVDPLFRTAADVYGSRVVGIVLSGGLDDGTSGLAVIKARGGVAIAQHPDDAQVTSMPLSAIRNVAVDHVVPVSGMASLLLHYASTAGPESGETTGTESHEEPRAPDSAIRGEARLDARSGDGPPSVFTCPECGGSLWELTNGGPLRYACHVGHAYGSEALVDAKMAALEPVLWTALRTLEENGALLRRMADRAASMALDLIADGYRSKAAETDRKADMIRSALTARPTAPDIHVVTKAEEIVEQAQVPASDVEQTAGARGNGPRRPE
jgi:two-component system chemotaxis response regulator CheB